LVPVMPYLELDNLFKLMQANLPTGFQKYFERTGYWINDIRPNNQGFVGPFPQWWQMTNSLTGTQNSVWALAQTRIALFLCPSDNAENRGNGWVTFWGDSTCNPIGNEEPASILGLCGAYFSANGGGSTLGRSNYLSNAGCIAKSTQNSYYA